MYDDYKCPKCQAHLRVGDHIILAAKNPKGTRGLVLLHPELGNYQVITHPGFSYQKGETLKFYCPVCHYSLDSSKHENLARIVMTDQEGKDFDIYFSKVAGEQSTLKMIGEFVEVFGPHSENYLDFFTLSQNY